VAQARGFSRAASLLGLTQPAVTVQVRALETAHGMRLFRRLGREVVLTDAGRALFELTQSMFAAEERIGEFLHASTSLETGTLSVAADGPHLALDVVSLLAKRHPRLRIAMRLGNTDSAVQDLLDQRVDAAVIALRRPIPRSYALPIYRRGMLALVPRGHALASRRRLRLPELADEPVILREAGSTTRRILDEAMRRFDVRLTPALELGSREAMREAVARGLGIGFLFERENEGDERTVAIPLAGLADVNVDAVVCLEANRRRAVVRALFEAARELARSARDGSS
jgi:aminoethylphosphonate catabolism LysR family transcriptional regulator